MNQFILLDAIGYLDTDLLEKHLARKEKLKKRRTIFRENCKRVGITAACLLLTLVSVVTLRYFFNDTTPTVTPDKVSSFAMGEICKSTVNDMDYSIVFDSVVLTREVSGEEKTSGGYLIFNGKIDTRDFAFLTEQMELEINIAKKSEDREQVIVFEKELSDTLSGVDLLFDNEIGAMVGDFCLVFSIDETDYSLIESKATQTSFENDQGTQIRLHSNIFWGGGKTVFDFSTADIRVTKNDEN